MVQGADRRVLACGFEAIQGRAADPKPLGHLYLAQTRLLPESLEFLRQPVGQVHGHHGRLGIYPYVGRLS